MSTRRVAWVSGHPSNSTTQHSKYRNITTKAVKFRKLKIELKNMLKKTMSICNTVYISSNADKKMVKLIFLLKPSFRVW